MELLKFRDLENFGYFLLGLWREWRGVDVLGDFEWWFLILFLNGIGDFWLKIFGLGILIVIDGDLVLVEYRLLFFFELLFLDNWILELFEFFFDLELLIIICSVFFLFLKVIVLLLFGFCILFLFILLL